MTKDDVYIFPLTLCDNEVDRDFECFSEEALHSLEKLFVGRTGISNHSMRTEDQTARIFYCYSEKDASRLTSYGKPYTALKARAYMVKTESNADLIKEIDGGIKKEVSVGCAAEKTLCSICGKNMKTHECSHIKGKTYKGQLCYGTLTDIKDAYEWSFVAVPAQRNAGVTKSFTLNQQENLNPADIIKSMSEEKVFSPDEAKQLKEYIASLEKQADEAKYYRHQLIEDISRSALIIMPGVGLKHFTAGCSNMEISALKQLRDDLNKQAKSLMPPALQLRPVTDKTALDNSNFII